MKFGYFKKIKYGEKMSQYECNQCESSLFDDENKLWPQNYLKIVCPSNLKIVATDIILYNRKSAPKISKFKDNGFRRPWTERGPFINCLFLR